MFHLHATIPNHLPPPTKFKDFKNAPSTQFYLYDCEYPTIIHIPYIILLSPTPTLNLSTSIAFYRKFTSIFYREAMRLKRGDASNSLVSNFLRPKSNFLRPKSNTLIKGRLFPLKVKLTQD